jgi:hypothetical protein
MKLTYKNNWENDEYYVGENRVRTLEKIRIGKKEYDVIMENRTVNAYDMGHVYPVTSNHFFVKTKVLGVMTMVDLNTIVPKTRVMVLKYS